MMKGKLVYPKHHFSPEDTLSFIETSAFTVLWRKKLGLSDDDLLCLQIAIMCDPAGPAVIPGTNGVRKLRFSPPGYPGGKSGALRVCYAYFPKHSTVGLGAVYPKGVREDLSADDKRAIAAALASIEKELDR